MDFGRFCIPQETLRQKFQLASEPEEKLTAEEKKERQETFAWLNRPTEFITKFGMADEVHVAINLTMTDEQILKDFNDWLTHERPYAKRGHDIVFCPQKPQDWEIERDRVYLYLTNPLNTIECAVKNLYDLYTAPPKLDQKK